MVDLSVFASGFGSGALWMRRRLRIRRLVMEGFLGQLRKELRGD